MLHALASIKYWRSELQRKSKPKEVLIQDCRPKKSFFCAHLFSNISQLDPNRLMLIYMYMNNNNKRLHCRGGYYLRR